MKIREAKSEDFDQIYSLLKQMGPIGPKEDIVKFYDFILNSDLHLALVVEENNQILGYSDIIFNTFHYACEFITRIETLIVDEKSRRKGIASGLVDCAAKEGKKRGDKKLELDSALHRIGAHKFYEAYGFTKRGYHFNKEIK